MCQRDEPRRRTQQLLTPRWTAFPASGSGHFDAATHTHARLTNHSKHLRQLYPRLFSRILYTNRVTYPSRTSSELFHRAFPLWFSSKRMLRKRLTRPTCNHGMPGHRKREAFVKGPKFPLPRQCCQRKAEEMVPKSWAMIVVMMAMMFMWMMENAGFFRFAWERSLC